MKQIKKKVNSININSSNYLKDYLNTLGIADENISSFFLICFILYNETYRNEG